MKVPSWTPWLVIGLWGVWLLGIVAHGLGANIWPPKANFEDAGAFGDAFGSLGSLMAALAAAGALLTLRQQQEQSRRENFESNFFGLLDHFQNLAQATQAHNWGVETDEDGAETEFLSHSFHGHQAFKAILDEFRQNINTRDFKYPARIKKKYLLFYESFQDDLGHYFRLLYHLFKMISDRCDGNGEQKYYYAQLVRAHLSTPELILLAYNCICGEGRYKFVRYLQEFSVLHNVGFSSDAFGKAEMGFITGALPSEVFVSRSQAAENETLEQASKEA